MRIPFSRILPDFPTIMARHMTKRLVSWFLELRITKQSCLQEITSYASLRTKSVHSLVDADVIFPLENVKIAFPRVTNSIVTFMSFLTPLNSAKWYNSKAQYGTYKLYRTMLIYLCSVLMAHPLIVKYVT